MADTIRAQQGDTLDALLWRERRLGSAALPIVLEANPGLAQLGPVLPLSTPVKVPDTASAAPRTLDLVQLWD
ncbi:tail protein X [Sphingomonas hylomeconis]|uniref:Tail protein X n=1 Tax=Sphingomonas hylomeconis TaxID=1395958 RepID=A0ABV7SVW7_9SPHN|nr:tail protein X [Sphingomonas hylomeconis]